MSVKVLVSVSRDRAEFVGVKENSNSLVHG